MISGMPYRETWHQVEMYPLGRLSASVHIWHIVLLDHSLHILSLYGQPTSKAYLTPIGAWLVGTGPVCARNEVTFTCSISWCPIASVSLTCTQNASAMHELSLLHIHTAVQHNKWFSSWASPSMVHVVSACLFYNSFVHAAWIVHPSIHCCLDLLSRCAKWNMICRHSVCCLLCMLYFILHQGMVCLLIELTLQCVLMSYTVDLHVCVWEYSTDTLKLRYYRCDWKCPVQCGCSMAVHLVTTKNFILS